MVKAYLRYEEDKQLGLVAAANCNSVLLHGGRTLVSGATQRIVAWNARTGECERECFEKPVHAHQADASTYASVCRLEAAPDARTVAAGYTDGTVRIWAIDEETSTAAAATKGEVASSTTATCVLRGHSRAVTTLHFAADGTRLASGSADTDVIVWDTVAERGLFRLRAHKGVVNGVVLLSKSAYLVSAGADALVKIWDLLAGPRCVQTLVLNRTEATSITISPDESFLCVGGQDAAIRVWDISNMQVPESEWKRGTYEHDADAANTAEDATAPFESAGTASLALYIGGVNRVAGRERVQELRFSPDAHWLAIVSARESNVEFFQVFDELSAKYRAKRRRKRAEKKKTKGGADTTTATKNGDAAASAVATDTATSTTAAAADTTAMPLTLTLAVDGSVDFIASDFFAPCGHFAVKSRVTSVHWTMSAHEQRGATTTSIASAMFGALLAATFHDNRAAVYRIENADESGEEPSRGKVATIQLSRRSLLENGGHRSDARAVALSSDAMLLMSASHSSVKIWNLLTNRCVATIATDYGLCGVFVPGDRHCIVGTKSGKLQIVDVAAAALIDTLEAHDGPVWSVTLRADLLGVYSGSADGKLSSWRFDLQQDDESEEEKEAAADGVRVARRLRLRRERHVGMSDQILSVCCGKDGKYVAVALLDATVRVVRADTHKFYTSLFGHRLPVLGMDISDDGMLIATGSGDKTLKIWGLDYGDCHRSLIAHEESVMAVSFVPNTHYVFTCGKDGRIREWDCDTFDLVQTLEAHVGACWSLAVSSNGLLLASGGADRSVRLWRRTDEQLFVEEEREVRLERRFGSTLEEEDRTKAAALRDEEVGDASRRTLHSVKAGERLMECVELCDEDVIVAERHEEAMQAWRQRIAKRRAKLERDDDGSPATKRRKVGTNADGEADDDESRMVRALERGDTSLSVKSAADPILSEPAPAKPPPNPLMLGKPRVDFLLHVLRQTRSADLDDALLALPFATTVRSLLRHIRDALQSSRLGGRDVELCARVVIALVNTYYRQFSATDSIVRHLLDEVRRLLHERLEEARRRIGVNRAALTFMERKWRDDGLINTALRRELVSKAAEKRAQSRRTTLGGGGGAIRL